MSFWSNYPFGCLDLTPWPFGGETVPQVSPKSVPGTLRQSWSRGSKVSTRLTPGAGSVVTVSGSQDW